MSTKPPPPGGPVRFRTPQPDPRRLRDGRHGAAMTAARLAEQEREQREIEETFPLVDPGDGRPPMRVRSTGGPNVFARGPDGSVMVGRVPRDPLEVLADRVSQHDATLEEMQATLAEILAQLSNRKTAKKGLFR